MSFGEMLNTTLAYTKSPKVTKRTTFQDELRAAVNARAEKMINDDANYSEDFDEEDIDLDDDEFLQQFFKTEKNKAGKVKTRKKKPPVNDFKFSDDEVDENERPKKVSFLKKRETSPKMSSDVTLSNDMGDKYRDLKHEKETLSKYASSRKESSPSLKSEKELARSHSDSNDPWHKRDSTDDEHRTTPRPRERKLRSTHSTGSLTDGDTPKPMPRQRTLKGSSPSREDSLGSNEEMLSRQATSSVSIPLSPTTRSTATSASETQRKLKSPSPKSSPPKSPTSPTISSRFSRYPSSLGDSRHFESILSKSNNGSAFEDSDNTEDSDPEENKGAKEVQRKSPTLMELMMSKTETSEMSKALSKHDKVIGVNGGTSPRMEERRKKKFGSTHLKGITKDRTLSSEDEDGDEPDSALVFKSPDTGNVSKERLLSSQGQIAKNMKSPKPYTTESRYLGTLKVLDLKAQDTSNLEEADTIRATIYQDWITMKKKTIQEERKRKKLEEQFQKENKKKEELNKKQEANASYTAWKEQKAKLLKTKMKENVEKSKEKQNKEEEKEERKNIAKKAFEKWKEEKDAHLMETCKKQKQAMRKDQQKVDEEKAEKERQCKAAFNNWNKSKETMLQDKIKAERKSQKIMRETVKYEKEMKEKLALDMYDQWLIKKETQERKQQKQKKFREILDEPPPPWCPPSKTVPFGK